MKFTITIFFALFCLPIFSQSSFLTDFQSKWKNASQYTLEFAEAMPEELYDYSPTEEEMKFRDQLAHIAGNMIWLCSSYLGAGEFEGDLSNPPKEKTALIDLLEMAFDFTQNTLMEFDEQSLDDEVDFFAGPMSKRKILFLIADHVTHHRGQLVVYLRLNDIKPPRYRGW